MDRVQRAIRRAWLSRLRPEMDDAYAVQWMLPQSICHALRDVGVSAQKASYSAEIPNKTLSLLKTAGTVRLSTVEKILGHFDVLDPDLKLCFLAHLVDECGLVSDLSDVFHQLSGDLPTLASDDPNFMKPSGSKVLFASGLFRLWLGIHFPDAKIDQVLPDQGLAQINSYWYYIPEICLSHISGRKRQQMPSDPRPVVQT